MNLLNPDDLQIYRAMNESFVSLLGEGTNLKQRKCLRCQKKFRSLNTGHRVCANCKRINAKVSSIQAYNLESA
jgi:DNA-directed RNA polymerase subunit RPC12/RpoP